MSDQHGETIMEIGLQLKGKENKRADDCDSSSRRKVVQGDSCKQGAWQLWEVTSNEHFPSADKY